MCRFVAYQGPPVLLQELLYKPEHSIIHQSTHASEREEPLNGDGWGVGWYSRRVSEEPGLYRTLHPAWSDDNMRNVAPTIESEMFLAHVRAASPGLPVQRLNCHPFKGGRHTHEELDELDPVERGRRRLLFMHNGEFGAYHQIIRRLQQSLDDDVFFGVRGTTDSEHVFAAVQQFLGDRAADPSLDDLVDAISKTLAYIQELKAEVGEGDEVTQANFCLSDGEQMAITRYTHPHDVPSQSLYVGTAEAFYCEDGEFRTHNPDEQGSVLVASERLWSDDRVWQKVPHNHVVKVDSDRTVSLEPLDIGG